MPHRIFFNMPRAVSRNTKQMGQFNAIFMARSLGFESSPSPIPARRPFQRVLIRTETMVIRATPAACTKISRRNSRMRETVITRVKGMIKVFENCHTTTWRLLPRQDENGTVNIRDER